MPRWLWWAPLGLLTLGAAVMGLRLGWIAATITETDVITRFSQTYLADHGAAAEVTDCYATPGQDLRGIWIVVRCQPFGGEGTYAYFVNGFGGLEYARRPGEGQSRQAEPQT